jgi:hypothetical protein
MLLKTQKTMQHQPQQQTILHQHPTMLHQRHNDAANNAAPAVAATNNTAPAANNAAPAAPAANNAARAANNTAPAAIKEEDGRRRRGAVIEQ